MSVPHNILQIGNHLIDLDHIRIVYTVDSRTVESGPVFSIEIRRKNAEHQRIEYWGKEDAQSYKKRDDAFAQLKIALLSTKKFIELSGMRLVNLKGLENVSKFGKQIKVLSSNLGNYDCLNCQKIKFLILSYHDDFYSYPIEYPPSDSRRDHDFKKLQNLRCDSK